MTDDVLPFPDVGPGPAARLDMTHVWQPAHIISLLELEDRQTIRLVTVVDGEPRYLAALDGVVRDGEDPAAITLDVLQLALAGLLMRQMAERQPGMAADLLVARGFHQADVVRRRTVRR